MTGIIRNMYLLMPGYSTKSEIVVIDMGSNVYYEIYFGISSDWEEHYYSEREFKEIQEKYEPIFEKIISSMKF